MAIISGAMKALNAVKKKRNKEKEKKQRQQEQKNSDDKILEGMKEVFKQMLKAFLTLFKFILPIIILIIIVMSSMGGIVDMINGLATAAYGFLRKLTYGSNVVVDDDDVDGFVEKLYERGITMQTLGMVSKEDSEEADTNEEGKDSKITNEQREYLKEYLLASRVTQSFYSPEPLFDVLARAKDFVRTYDKFALGAYTKSGSIRVKVVEENGVQRELEHTDIEFFTNFENFYTFDDEGYINYKYAGKERRVYFYNGILNSDVISEMFFIDLCQTTQNPEYVADIAKEIIENSKTEIWILTNGTIEMSIENNSASVTKKSEDEYYPATIGKSNNIFYQYEREIKSNSVETVGEPTYSEDAWGARIQIDHITTTYTNIYAGYKNARVKYNESDKFVKYTKQQYETYDTKSISVPYKIFEDGSEQLFENMERNIDNDRLVQILKYLFYMMNNHSYGVTELDLDLKSKIYDLGDFRVSTTEDDIPVINDRNELIDIFAQKNGIARGSYTYDKPSENEFQTNMAKIGASSSIVSEYKLINFKYVVDDILEAQEKYEINALYIMAVGECESNTGADYTGNHLMRWDTKLNWLSTERGNSMFGDLSDKGEIYKNGDNISWHNETYSGETWEHGWTVYQKAGTVYYDFAHYSRFEVDRGNETVDSIAPHYCNAAWGTTVKRLIIEFCNAGGLEINQGGNAGGNGDNIVVGAVIDESSMSAQMATMLKEAVRICDDPSVGYILGAKNGPNFDCSGLVYYLYLNYYNISVPSYTAAYPDSELECHDFSYGNIESLKPGDILWRAGHVAIYIGDGLIAQARGNSKEIGPFEDQVAVCRLYYGGFGGIFTNYYRVTK